MLKNHNHDLVQQLSEISDSLWRVDKYLENSAHCPQCQNLWETLKTDYEKHVSLLRDELARHVQEGEFE